MRRHLLIAGTGRAGTSFLVRYLSALGLDTHLSRSETWDENAQAGLEDFVLHGDNLPYVIKSPWLYQHIDQVLARDDIRLDGVIVPMRDIVEASVSRTIVEMRNAHQALPFLADEVKMWDTIGHTAGGVVFSLNPIDQARLLALGFHNLIYFLTKAEVPIYLVEFPRIVRDSEYLFRQLRPVLPSGVDQSQARQAFEASADGSMVRTSAELSAQAGDVAVAAKYPSNASLEIAALKRELKRLRSELLTNASFFGPQSLASQQYCHPCELSPGMEIVQRFVPLASLERVSVRLVTFGRSPSSYMIDWRIVASAGEQSVELGAGQLDAAAVQDWSEVHLPVSDTAERLPSEIAVYFRVDAAASPDSPIGIPLYRRAPGSQVRPAEIGGAPEASGAQVGLMITYRDRAGPGR